jgi:hypothetical protein
MKHLVSIVMVFSLLVSCSIFGGDDYIINDGEGIQFIFDEGLNEDERFQLRKDSDGFYQLVMGKFKTPSRSARAKGLTTQCGKKNSILNFKSGVQNPLKKTGRIPKSLMSRN